MNRLVQPKTTLQIYIFYTFISMMVYSGFVQGSEGEAIAHADVPGLVGKRQLCPVQGSKYYYGI